MPDHNDSHYAFRKGDWQIKWEKHTEFSTFTFVSARDQTDHLFSGKPVQCLPRSWLTLLEDKLFVAVHAELLEGSEALRARQQAHEHITGPVLVGSKVLSGGEIYCDWTVHEDNFSRFLVLDMGFREAQAGRLVQRLFEIETYRMMALLALPDARRHSRLLSRLDFKLASLMHRMNELEQVRDEAYLLKELTELAGQIEAHATLESRFSASKAYERLVLARISELREVRIEGYPTIAEFMQRRLQPAMQTCSSVWARHEQTATRVARAVDLLRTRVNLSQEEHTTALLEGMNRTARTQLHLQHAVEGLSVAAISYYVLNLLTAGFRAMHAADVPVNPEISEGILIFPVLVAVLLFTRRLRKHGMTHARSNEGSNNVWPDSSPGPIYPKERPFSRLSTGQSRADMPTSRPMISKKHATQSSAKC